MIRITFTTMNFYQKCADNVQMKQNEVNIVKKSYLLNNLTVILSYLSVKI